MSNINTSGINVNYPVPGVNNSSQGFRDNFTTIRINLDTAYNEITDLQNKAVVKTALANSSLNNDMANTLISNALTRSFRASTYNLGSSLSGVVTVDVSLGDVQYGTVVGDITLQFGKWAPSGTQSNVQLMLTVTNNANIIFPDNVTVDSLSTIENYVVSNDNGIIIMPAGLTSVDYCYRFSTITCGDTINIEPFNHPRHTRQIQQRSPNPVGVPGDMNGAVAVDYTIDSLSITETFANGSIQSSTSVSELYPDLEVTLNGTGFGGLANNTTYYVTGTNTTSNTFSLSSTVGGANIVLTAATGTMTLAPESYLYVCTAPYTGTNVATVATNTTAVTNTITVNTTTGMVVNSPIVFNPSNPLTSTMFGGLEANTVYYIKTIASPNITVSRTRINGVAGTVFPLTTGNSTSANGDMTVNTYTGYDIWKRIKLSSW